MCYLWNLSVRLRYWLSAFAGPSIYYPRFSIFMIILTYPILTVGDPFLQETKVDGDTSSLWYIARAIYKLQVHYILSFASQSMCDFQLHALAMCFRTG